MDFLTKTLNSTKEEKKEEKEEKVSEPDDGNTLAIPSMSAYDDATTQPDESTVAADKSSQQIENCLVLDKRKKPLKTDVELIESGDFKGLIAQSFGRAKPDSEGRIGWAKDPHNTAYYDKEGIYNACTANRLEREQTIKDETGAVSYTHLTLPTSDLV